MQNNLNQPKDIYLNSFKGHSKEDLIKEIIFNQKEIRNDNFETKKVFLKISRKLNILVWFLVIIPIICTLIILLF
jgi:hypothetical protein